jgi:hypothetical protein
MTVVIPGVTIQTPENKRPRHNMSLVERVMRSTEVTKEQQDKRAERAHHNAVHAKLQDDAMILLKANHEERARATAIMDQRKLAAKDTWTATVGQAELHSDSAHLKLHGAVAAVAKSQHDGDLAHYTDEALNERRSLRDHPDVVAVRVAL